MYHYWIFRCTNKNNTMLLKLFTITVQLSGIKQRVREQNRKSCKSNTLENLMHEVLPLCDLRL